MREDLTAVSEYARLLASVGIDGCNVNNVNGAAPFLTPEWLAGMKRIADELRPWGVRLSMSVDIASPQKIGGLATFDPLDPGVKAWWAAKVDEVYKLIPDFAGFTVKADSEGQAGPASYGRSPADAANLLANALKPRGGIVLYRAFVYNNHLDYNDLKADRARAAYDIFHPLDVRPKRHCADQGRPDRLSGARARVASVRGTWKDLPGNGGADHAGVSRATTPSGVYRANVDAGARLRFARSEPVNAGEGDH